MNADNEVLSKPLLFGKYCLLERISVGGMAEVFKAKQFGVEGFERLLAVKRILDTIAEDEVFIKMFIDEAKIAGQLNHPNIAQIFDLGKVDGSYFIALEYVSGKDLRTIWEQMVDAEGPADIFLGCHTVMKVCEALQYAHTKKDAAGNDLHIVHRDISPQNILMSYEGDVKIIDFGIAKATGKSSQTQVGILKGKFSYMSPEQVRGLHVDHRADIFSLGIVLYELLTLKRLFLGESDFDTLEKIRKVEMSPPTLYNPHIPRELEDIVLKSLAKNPDERYQNGSEFHDALERFMRNQSSYYGTKDLANHMKSAFARDIESERRKLDHYRTINIESLGGVPVAPTRPRAEVPDVLFADEPDTQAYSRSAPDINEISPAADWNEAPVVMTGGGDGPTSMSGADPRRKTGASPAVDPRRKTGANPAVGGLMAAGAAPGALPEVDLNKPLDAEDDPTIEWDRFDVSAINAGPGARPPRAPEPAPAPPPAPEPPPEPAPRLKAPEPALAPAAAGPVGPDIFDVSPASERAPRRIADEDPSPLNARRQHRSSAGLIGALLGFIAVLILAGVSAAYFLPRLLEADKAQARFQLPEGVKVTITVDDKVVPHAVVGKDVVVSDLAPGDRKITVSAEGFEPLTDTVKMAAGVDYEIPVALKAVGQVAATPAVAATEDDLSGTGLDIQVQPADAVITLDGQRVADPVPVTRRGLKPNKYVLVFKKEGFLEETREVAVVRGEIKTVEVTLRPARVALEVRANIAGAEVSVYERAADDEKNRQLVKTGKVPLKLPGLDATRVYDVELSMAGHMPWKQTFEPGLKDSELLMAELEKEKVSEPVAAITPPAQNNNAAADRQAERQAEREARRKELEEQRRKEKLLAENSKPPRDTNPPREETPKVNPDPIVPQGGPGYVAITSKPQARVILDGRDIGYTPKLKIELPPGRHSVTLKMEGIDVVKSYSFTIKPNATHVIKGRP